VGLEETLNDFLSPGVLTDHERAAVRAGCRPRVPTPASA
jgi:hypothetical protein